MGVQAVRRVFRLLKPLCGHPHSQPSPRKGEGTLEDEFAVAHQNDFGRSSTWVATWERMRFVEIGATW